MWSKSQENTSSMDSGNISFEKNAVIIRIVDLLKTSTQKFHLGEIKFLNYHDKTFAQWKF